ncbi:MAG: SpoIIIAH-like family protein [Bacillota bacterium]
MARFIVVSRRIMLGILIMLFTAGIFIAACGNHRAVRGQKAGSVIQTLYPVSVSSHLQPPSDTDEFFVDYRIDREVKRSRQIELLQEIAVTATTSDSIRTQAQEKVINLVSQTEKEAMVENLLRAKGFRDAVVAIEDQGVTVIVPGKVTPEVTATVTALVYHSLGMAQEQVMILGRE